MTDLLEMAVAAHGGLERWSTINTIDVDLSITGAVWYVKGRPNVLKNITMQVHTDAERVSTTFADKDMRTTFEPDRVVIEKKTARLSRAAAILNAPPMISRPVRPGTMCTWRTSAGKPSGPT
jgi:hypothetical protein